MANSFNGLNPLFIFLVSGLWYSILADTISSLRSLENRLLPWFTDRQLSCNRHLLKRSTASPPATADLMKIAAHWNNLSDGFKKIYQESLKIPSDFLVYYSPGFNIELYYTLDGASAVDGSDSAGTDTSDWRVCVNIPNGIPDYVDETARALDSAWSMEVERFGFPAPLPYKAGYYSSDNYKAVIETMGSDYYGLTYPVDTAVSAGGGFASIVTIRNEWQGWDINDIIDYESHPEKGIKITCVHEFFHAIQYWMVRRVEEDIHLDNFPLSWIEGTACAMEELGFPDVNDYTQYSGSYFDNPGGFTAFGGSVGNDIYSNVLVCLFICNFVAPTPHGVGFFRTVFTNNMTVPAPFGVLLESASECCGTTWVAILNAFHAGSFYTGNRTAGNKFIDDAAMLPTWDYSPGEGNRNKTVNKTVRPSCMQYVSFLNQDSSDSTLHVAFVIPGIHDPVSHAISIILRDTANPASDTTLRLAPSSSDTVTRIIDNWSKWDEAIAVVTNGFSSIDLPVTFIFNVNSSTPARRPPFHGTAYSQTGHSGLFLLNGRRLPRALQSIIGSGAAASQTPFGSTQGLYIKQQNHCNEPFIAVY